LEHGDVLEVMNFTIVVGTLDRDPCWQALFLSAVNNASVRIDRNEFTTLGYSGYRQFVEAIHDLVGGDLELVQSTNSWLQELRSVETILTSLEIDGDSYPAIHCILVEQQPDIRRRYLKMLQCYMKDTDKAKKTLLQELILALRNTNSAHVSQAVMAISKVDAKGFSQCEDLMMICRKDSNVASARLAVWLKKSDLNDATEAALSSLGKVLNLGLDNDLDPPRASLEPARKDYARRVAELVARAQQLEKARLSLMRTDPNGVKAMISELGLEAPPSGIAALTASLPNNLTHVITEIGDDEVELSLPLSKDLNAMEHLAFGLKGTETLTVHLQLNERDKFDAFCVHIQNRGDFALQRHNFYKAKSPPDRLFCEGTKLTRLTYIVARNLWRAIYEQGETSLKRLYEGIRAVMQASATLCMVCGSNISTPRLRPTLCINAKCKATYLRTPLDLRLQDVRSNGRVVDLLLTSVFAAANVKNLGLLPGRPSLLNDAAKLQILLNSLPPTIVLASAPDFTTGLRGCGQRAELLLSWLCTAYRGFLVPATGSYKLPKMGNIHQFLVVNNPPEIEAAFAVHNHHQQRHVLFHGTSMDRLYAILVQGLKICSHTPLQKHGAASGPGIYTGREPGTATSYAAATQTNNNFNGFYNSRTDFRNSSVILGLEHAGNHGGGGGVHVVTDPTRILLRYIFIIPPHTNAPRASDIVPAMLNAFQSLKTAAAQRSVDGAGSYWGTERCSVM
jgi:RNA polymerase-binding transcription factor DksA